MSRFVPLLWNGILPSSRDASRVEVDEEEVRGSKEDDEASRLFEERERERNQSRLEKTREKETRTHVVLSEDMSEDS